MAKLKCAEHGKRILVTPLTVGGQMLSTESLHRHDGSVCDSDHYTYGPHHVQGFWLHEVMRRVFIHREPIAHLSSRVKALAKFWDKLYD